MPNQGDILNISSTNTGGNYLNMDITMEVNNGYQ